MAKVIMTCGKICSGKSTYAEKMRNEKNAVILSVDEITLALLGQTPGEILDDYVEKLKEYFFDKSIDIISVGVNVVLDWGFWTKAERNYAREFYGSRNVAFEIHYMDVSDEIWHERLDKRNREIEAGEVEAYYVDGNLAKKAEKLFETPGEDETDIVYISRKV